MLDFFALWMTAYLVLELGELFTTGYDPTPKRTIQNIGVSFVIALFTNGMFL